MIGFFKNLAEKGVHTISESKVQRAERFNREAYERARALQDVLSNLLEESLKPSRPDLLTMQAAFIYRLQQDIYHIYGINLARLEPFKRSYEGAALFIKVMSVVEELFKIKHRYWHEKYNKGDRNGILLGAMMTHSCEFWIVNLFADGSDFLPLTMCVEQNNMIVASVSKENMIAEARNCTNLLLQTGTYELQESHWPYVDVDRAIDDYHNATKDGTLAEQFLRMLAEKATAEDDDGLTPVR